LKAKNIIKQTQQKLKISQPVQHGRNSIHTGIIKMTQCSDSGCWNFLQYTD